MSRRGGDGRGSSRRAAGASKPEKLCASCGRPFQWRRKWAACWEQVKYCSDRCRARGAGG
ncbi:MAG: DUF2256 domain-containing protein [Planctomycetaceae bacterium]